MAMELACSHVYDLSYRHLQQIDGKGCDVCGVKISGEAYTCLRCLVWLHSSCAEKLPHGLPHVIIHHHLRLRHELDLELESRDFICDKCLYISGGYRYRCTSCDFSLDLTCAASVDDKLPKDQESLRFKDGKKKTIQHFSHTDKLTLFKYRKINEEDYDCVWCEKCLCLSEVCYGCLRCKFFLHKECSDKMPRTLYHPFHPRHPLCLHFICSSNHCHACGEDIVFRTNNCLSYWCRLCNFCLDFRCAKLLPTLKHECHDHLLTYFGITSGRHRQDFYCKACGKLCDANVYRCVQCDFSFHLQCVPMPFSTKYIHKHLLNEDKVSSKEISSSASQSMDNKCLLEAKMEHKEGNDDVHTDLNEPLIHEHPMRIFEVTEELKEKQYCNGCRLVLSGRSYICTRCPNSYGVAKPKEKYYLHEKCAKLRREIQHPFHSSHRLNLHATDPPPTAMNIICDECREVCQGFIYLCEGCNFKLDVKCSTLTAHKIGVSQLNEMDRVTELHHFNHHHKLVLGYCNDPIDNPECIICELPISGPAYSCPESNCFYILHESCLGLPQEIQVPFHLEHILVMSDNTYNSLSLQCYACPLSLNSLHFKYNCEHCHLSLHSICANSLSRPFKFESHQHSLYYFGTNYQLLYANYRDPSGVDLFSCAECQKSCGGGPFYRCIECAINFHLKCVPIPDIVKSRYHIHPLTLKESFVEDDSGKYYCDFCEEERNPNDHVYHCEECNVPLVAHIECVLAKVEEVMS